MEVDGMLREQRSSNLFLPMWSKALRYINNLSDSIIEIGCGSGGFADFALKNGYNYKWGIDSRSEVIEQAQRNGGKKFLCVDESNVVEFLKCYDFDVLVFFNVPSGGVKDLELFAKIKQVNPNTRLILSFMANEDSRTKRLDNFVDIVSRYRCLMKLNVNRHSSIKLSEGITCLIGEYAFVDFWRR